MLRTLAALLCLSCDTFGEHTVCTDCPAGKSCLYRAGTPGCYAPCLADGGCASGVCTSCLASCPNCRDCASACVP